MSWVDKILPAIRRDNAKELGASSHVPEGLWEKCAKCDSVLYRPELEKIWMFVLNANTTCVLVRVDVWISF